MQMGNPMRKRKQILFKKPPAEKGRPKKESKDKVSRDYRKSPMCSKK